MAKKYRHIRQRKPSAFKRGTFKTVPIGHTNYKGKYRKRGNKAVVGKLKSGKWKVQKILVKK